MRGSLVEGMIFFFFLSIQTKEWSEELRVVCLQNKKWQNDSIFFPVIISLSNGIVGVMYRTSHVVCPDKIWKHHYERL